MVTENTEPQAADATSLIDVSASPALSAQANARQQQRADAGTNKLIDMVKGAMKVQSQTMTQSLEQIVRVTNESLKVHGGKVKDLLESVVKEVNEAKGEVKEVQDNLALTAGDVVEIDDVLRTLILHYVLSSQPQTEQRAVQLQELAVKLMQFVQPQEKENG